MLSIAIIWSLWFACGVDGQPIKDYEEWKGSWCGAWTQEVEEEEEGWQWFIGRKTTSLCWFKLILPFYISVDKETLQERRERKRKKKKRPDQFFSVLCSSGTEVSQAGWEETEEKEVRASDMGYACQNVALSICEEKLCALELVQIHMTCLSAQISLSSWSFRPAPTLAKTYAAASRYC